MGRHPNRHNPRDVCPFCITTAFESQVCVSVPRRHPVGPGITIPGFRRRTAEAVRWAMSSRPHPGAHRSWDSMWPSRALHMNCPMPQIYGPVWTVPVKPEATQPDSPSRSKKLRLRQDGGTGRIRTSDRAMGRAFARSTHPSLPLTWLRLRFQWKMGDWAGVEPALREGRLGGPSTRR